MKKSLFKFLAFATILIFANACNETLVIDESTNEELSLKSANNGKQSYIVVLQDANLDVELSNLKGYEKKQAAMKSASAKLLKRAGVLDGEVGYVYGTALKGFSVKIPLGQLKKLENDPAVKYVEENKMVSLIEPYAKPGEITTQAAQETPYGITRVKGGATYGDDEGETKVVWVIDTGIDLDHEDLNVDGSRGVTYISRTTTPDDDNGHGSHCAGTIGAIDNGVGVVGVAAGVTLIPVKVLDKRGSGTTDGVIAGVNYVAANGSKGDVASMSLGGGAWDALDEAVYNASEQGIKFALAAGNESDDANNHSPARVNGPNIYTISAMDINDNWAYFSNFGNPPVDYCEPGVSIYSTYKSGGYATLSGTSMATPHMAGILVWGDPTTDGYVNGDPDGNADPIGVVGDSGVDPDPDPDPTNTPPVAGFSAEVDGLTVTFTNTSTDDDGDALNMSWDFGDGNTSTAISPVHTYESAGTYTVSLTADDATDTDVATQSVTVNENSGGDEIILDGAITGNKVKKVTLTWSGASGATVTLYINGEPNVISNSGSYIENLGKITGGDYIYYIVDEAGVTSNLIDLSF